MAEKRVSLYDHLPEIYRIRDEEQNPSGQLKQYLALVEDVFSDIHKNIESLYDDLFIETCDDWVVPYIGDLLGVSHLKGDSWTLRADVADTIKLRRRKGTLASIERLTYNLTQWGAHCVELRENLVWAQHLNHQRPDQGGDPPYGLPSVTRFTPIRGGTVALRDPATLSLLNTPFDPFAHFPDLKPPAFGNIRYNLPNLAVFLWRLEDYKVPVIRPGGIHVIPSESDGPAIVRITVHPLGYPVRLFNTNQYEPDLEPPVVTEIDEVPGPIPTQRLNKMALSEQEASESSEQRLNRLRFTGSPEKYLSIETYFTDNPLETSTVGLHLHLPEEYFSGEDWPNGESSDWTIKGANLCAWEEGLPEPVLDREVYIDPEIGRIIIGVVNEEGGEIPTNDMLVTYTYGSVGPVGAHPTTRFPIPARWNDPLDEEVTKISVSSGSSLTEALAATQDEDLPVIIEITDSRTYELNLSAPAFNHEGEDTSNIRLDQSLLIRATSGERPIILLDQPLRFRPRDPGNAADLNVRLEGLYISRRASFTSDEPLIARVALNRLEIINCTLEPGGQLELDGSVEGSRAQIQNAMKLPESYGFDNPAAERAFDQTPEILIERSITGPLLIDRAYRLFLKDSIIDAGIGTGDETSDQFAVTAATDLVNGWGPSTVVEGVTVFGQMQVEDLSGQGGIWVHRLQVHNDQTGCIKFSYFSDQNDRLPKQHACVDGSKAKLHFTSEIFGQPGYGQLMHTTDFRIRERGPNDDAMGAFGFLKEAHKWRNLQIRFREFMPVGVRPLMIPVT